MREAQAAQAEAIEIAQVRKLLLQRRAAFEADHDGNLSLALGAADVRGRVRQNEMLGCLHFGMRVIKRAHEALQIGRRKACRGRYP